MKLPNRNKARKAERRASAAVRQAEHAQLTPAQKLVKLDERLGKGAGAQRERVRLQKQLKGGQQPVEKSTAEAVFGVAETTKELKSKKGTRAGKSKA